MYARWQLLAVRLRGGWLTYVAVALTVGVTCAAVGNGSAGWRATYVAVAVSGAFAAARALRLADGRLGWALLLVAELFFAAGDVLTHDSRRLFGRPLAAPWVANLPSLAGYALVVAAIVVFVRARDHGRSRPALIDGLIVALPAIAASWIFLMAPVAHRHTVLVSTKFITLAYPVLDLVVAVSLVQFASARRCDAPLPSAWSSRVSSRFSPATFSTAGPCCIRISSRRDVARESGRIVFAVLIGAAALHPTAAELTKPAGSESHLRPTPCGSSCSSSLRVPSRRWSAQECCRRTGWYR